MTAPSLIKLSAGSDNVDAVQRQASEREAHLEEMRRRKVFLQRSQTTVHAYGKATHQSQLIVGAASLLGQSASQAQAVQQLFIQTVDHRRLLQAVHHPVRPRLSQL